MGASLCSGHNFCSSDHINTNAAIHRKQSQHAIIITAAIEGAQNAETNPKISMPQNRLSRLTSSSDAQSGPMSMIYTETRPTHESETAAFLTATHAAIDDTDDEKSIRNAEEQQQTLAALLEFRRTAVDGLVNRDQMRKLVRRFYVPNADAINRFVGSENVTFEQLLVIYMSVMRAFQGRLGLDKELKRAMRKEFQKHALINNTISRIDAVALIRRYFVPPDRVIEMIMTFFSAKKLTIDENEFIDAMRRLTRYRETKRRFICHRSVVAKHDNLGYSSINDHSVTDNVENSRTYDINTGNMSMSAQVGLAMPTSPSHQIFRSPDNAININSRNKSFSKYDSRFVPMLNSLQATCSNSEVSTESGLNEEATSSAATIS